MRPWGKHAHRGGHIHWENPCFSWGRVRILLATSGVDRRRPGVFHKPDYGFEVTARMCAAGWPQERSAPASVCTSAPREAEPSAHFLAPRALASSVTAVRKRGAGELPAHPLTLGQPAY
jgi:hypothetical protein